MTKQQPFQFNIVIKISFCLWLLLQIHVSGYEIPDPTIEVTEHNGFKVSIPHEPGIMVFAFHGKLNKEFLKNEPGDFQAIVNEPTNNRWIYDNPNAVIQINDRIYYWIFVQFENLGYRLEGQSFQVTEYGTFINKIPVTTTIGQPSTGPSCEISDTLHNSEHVCVGKVLFEDNFETLNYSKWENEVRIPLDTEDAEFVSYQNRNEVIYVRNGKLFIVPKLLTEFPGYTNVTIRNGLLDLGSECTIITGIDRECKRKTDNVAILPPVVSAKIRTKKSFRFLYGKLEIRAKLPKGDWIFPEIFLESYENVYGTNNYASGQIRVAFILGNEKLVTADGREIDGSRLHSNLVVAPQYRYRELFMRTKNYRKHYGDDFHNYTMIWTRQKISMYVDGENFANYEGKLCPPENPCPFSHYHNWESGLTMAPFDRQFYLVLGVGVGGLSDFPDLSETGTARMRKPWNNTDPRAELKFFTNQQHWYSTWNGENSGLQVESIKVTAL